MNNKANLRLRDIMVSDVDEIYNLYKLEGWNSFNKNLVEKLIGDAGSKWSVAEQDGEIVAFARYLTDNVLTVFLAEIIVKQAYRKQGIGKLIIDDIFAKNPNQRIELITDTPKFYERLKFRDVGKAYRRYQNE